MNKHAQDTTDGVKKVGIIGGGRGGTALLQTLGRLWQAGADVDWKLIDGKEAVFVYDNEKRSKEIVNRIEKAIDKGYEVVIWPSSLKEKDLNDMFSSGHDVQSMVEFNTYRGLEAKIKLSEWKKV